MRYLLDTNAYSDTRFSYYRRQGITLIFNEK